MTTQTLRGLKTLDPFHWRGDRTNFTHFNGAFASLLGGTVLSTADINAYRDFINTIPFEPNPNQKLDRTLPTTFAGANPTAGRNAYISTNYVTPLTCNTCHSLPEGSGRFIVSGQLLQESQDFKVPHLRNIYQKTSLDRGTNANSIGGFGFQHDGRFADLFTFLSQPVFGVFANDPVVKSNIQAFVLCFDTGTAPAVGYSRTLAATNVTSTSISNDWTMLESQAALGMNIDLVVKGTIDGKRRGLLYQPGSSNYKLDSTNSTPLTHAQLVTKISAGDMLTITGVPSGAGQRMGIDRNLNGVLDADEPLPALQIALTGGSAVINWPLSAAGFTLEETTDLGFPIWSDNTNAVEIVGNSNFITNAPATATKFFRLRQK